MSASIQFFLSPPTPLYFTTAEWNNGERERERKRPFFSLSSILGSKNRLVPQWLNRAGCEKEHIHTQRERKGKAI